MRNSHQEPSTDSETKEGSQDSGAEDFKRQTSEESRRISFDNRQVSAESRQGSFETRQSSHESRQSSFDGRQASHDGGPRLGLDGRTTSRESGLSRESSADSAAADLEGTGSNLSPSAGQTKVGTKRGRLLMRQQRVKKESDVRASPDSDPGSPGFPPSSLLSVPPVKIERQRSEPTTTAQARSPPPQTGSNLLAVPRPSFPARQHSFPSQSPPTFPSGTLLVQRQLSQPLTSAKSVQMAEETSRAASPSVAAESLPVVRIISDSDQTKTNSSYRQRSEESKRQASTPEIPETCRSVHCPVLRTGPALGCNYCWNTIDAHGRILRRKTKYHCPECQTNLCIVPCFQEYHHRQVEISGKTEGQPSAS